MERLIAETVHFKRPDSDIMEIGVMIGKDDKHIIVDSNLNIIINCSIEHYENNQQVFSLLKL